MEVLCRILLHFRAPQPACFPSDHLFVRCVFGLLHLIIPNHSQQAERCPVVSSVPGNTLSCLGFLRGHINYKGSQAASRFGHTSESSNHSRWSHLDLTSPQDSAIWCLFTVAFFSFLRKSNLTAPSPRRFDPTRHLCRDDIKFTSQGVVLRIKWSKTLQHKDRLLFVPLPLIPGSPLCPVTAILQFFSLVPAPASAPFFCVPRNGSLRPLTYTDFTSSIKSLISRIGLHPTEFSPHSFRRGGATFAFQAGVPERLIQRHGDWRSDAYRRYLALPLSQRTMVADLMAAGLS